MSLWHLKEAVLKCIIPGYLRGNEQTFLRELQYLCALQFSTCKQQSMYDRLIFLDF